MIHLQVECKARQEHMPRQLQIGNVHVANTQGRAQGSGDLHTLKDPIWTIEGGSVHHK